jgi:sulfate/thiosulfate transport system permease protein
MQSRAEELLSGPGFIMVTAATAAKQCPEQTGRLPSWQRRGGGRASMAQKKFNALPGFGLTLGFTLFYLSAIVLIPFAGLVVRACELSWSEFWSLATTPRALAAYQLTFGASLLAAIANAVFGTLLAWVLVRYEFPGRRFIDAIVDFPFALPTAVAGLTLSSLFASNGWVGRYLVPLGIQGAFSPLGVVIALTFVGMPFVVRTLQPVMQNLEREIEEAAATLGASRVRTLTSIIAPTLLPTILTGFALAFARAVGEYGSIVFISGNKPFKTEIAPYLIVMRLEEYDYKGAIALAIVLLVFSFLLLGAINLLEQWSSRFQN